ncbi:MAG: 2,4-dihydroxyhept-2-ene-1,7-dioic acid aldolase [Candidatus Tectomicrobia bacterium]|nr:2,4-dihydroxyhept-2-ene-1,7-dioic acid aldolase [Candidatus Tectomicrobia bacterium]
MRRNKFRELLNAGQPTVGTHVHSTWPSIVEAIGHTGMYDYVEFVAEYGPFDLYSLDNFCRAVELFDMSAMIKVDQEPRGFLAQRGIGSGFQSVLFADCRSVEDVQQCVRIVRPDTLEDGGIYGVATRRFSYMGYGGSPEYVQALRDVVVAIMIEKQSAVDQLEEILSVKGVDMIQWGPADYSMNIGRGGERNAPEIKATERKVIETCLRMGVPPRAEIGSVDQAKYYLDMGVHHFCIGTDISILHNWWKANGDGLRKAILDA